MIITRKEALKKLRENFDKESPEFILSRLMDFYENMSDESLKAVLEKRFDAFVIIDHDPIHHS
jgi:hypothetical protein